MPSLLWLEETEIVDTDGIKETSRRLKHGPGEPTSINSKSFGTCSWGNVAVAQAGMERELEQIWQSWGDITKGGHGAFSTRFSNKKKRQKEKHQLGSHIVWKPVLRAGL